jgi:exonuclease III
LGGNSYVSTYVSENSEKLILVGEFSQIYTRWSVIQVCDLYIHNVYFNSNSAPERCSLLKDMNSYFLRIEKSNNLILGDFNLAPREIDGIYGDTYSAFTTKNER